MRKVFAILGLLLMIAGYFLVTIYSHPYVALGLMFTTWSNNIYFYQLLKNDSTRSKRPDS